LLRRAAAVFNMPEVTTRGDQRSYSMRKKSNEVAMTAINKHPERQ
jgi:hypothetical protein